MNRQNLFASVLVVLVSVPGFLLGHQIRYGGASVALLSVLVGGVVVLAGAIMKQID